MSKAVAFVSTLLLVFYMPLITSNTDEALRREKAENNLSRQIHAHKTQSFEGSSND
jgi:hypothetical protein